MDAGDDVKPGVYFKGVSGGQFYGDEVGKGADEDTRFIQLSVGQYLGVAGVAVDAGRLLGAQLEERISGSENERGNLEGEGGTPET